MALQQIRIANFRNLKDVTLDFNPNINLITGQNAAGKTSLLEALSVIVQGKSFRTRKLIQCVTRGQESFLLFARNNNHGCGFRYGKNHRELRIDGKNIHRIRDLARITAVMAIDHQTTELVTGSPAIRRQFIDWLVFHVKPSYADQWSQAQYILKQRNAILRQGTNLDLLDYWDPLLVEHTKRIQKERRSVLSDLLSDDFGYRIEYKQGFDDEYARQLIKDRDQDIRQGYTRHSFARADLKITKKNQPVIECCSRGQLKALSIEIKSRSAELIRRKTQKPCIVLIDDLQAELDRENCTRLYQRLISLGLQIFVTGLSHAAFTDAMIEGGRMFHVEHGMIRPDPVGR